MRTLFCSREKEMEQLKASWNKICSGDNPAPQLVVLLGESGLGKTRIVQEFYSWLSTHHDGIGKDGYWPDELGQIENNLLVNPEPATCNNDISMPFLWWGVRLSDSGERNDITSDALQAHFDHLIPHLDPMYDARNRVERLKEGMKTLGTSTVDIVMSLIPGATTLSVTKTAGQAAFELAQLARKDIKDHQKQSIDEIAETKRKSLTDRILNDFELLFSSSDDLNQLPGVLFIDDAQFSITDPSTCEFIKGLLDRAWKRNWPLMILVTHWEKQWKDHVGNEKASIANIIEISRSLIGQDWHPISLQPAADLRPMLTETLPGLLTDQQTNLTRRAGGNPQYLEDIMRFCVSRKRFFVDRDISQPMTEDGLSEVMLKSVKHKTIIEERFKEDCTEHVQSALALASLQGMQFLCNLIYDVGDELKIGGTKNGLSEAENPHSFVRGIPLNIAEFSQRIYHEVASEELDEFADRDEARMCLSKQLKKYINEPTEIDKLSLPEQNMIFSVAVTHFEKSEDQADLRLAAQSLIQLISRTLNSYDYASANSLLDRFMRGLNSGKWSFEGITFHEICFLFLAATKNARIEYGINTAHEALLAAQREHDACPSYKTLRSLSVAQNFIGDMALRNGDLEGALNAFNQSLEIRKQLAEELKTPEARRDLSVSWNKVGDMALRNGDLEGALNAFNQSLEIAQQLAEELKTPEARRDLSVSWNKVGDMALRNGDLEGALNAFNQSLEIAQQLAEELKTPEARRDLSVSFFKLGEFFASTGGTKQATSFFNESLQNALLYQQRMPSPEADGLVEAIEAKLN